MNRQVCTFHYELKDEKGQILESSRQGEPLSFLQGSGSIIPGLESAIESLNTGDVKDVHVPYQDAYGPYDQNLISKIPRSQFPSQTLKEGDLFEIRKGHAVRIVLVLEVGNDSVTIDANHPLAGKDLFFSVEILKKRDATAEEIDHGHVH